MAIDSCETAGKVECWVHDMVGVQVYNDNTHVLRRLGEAERGSMAIGQTGILGLSLHLYYI